MLVVLTACGSGSPATAPDPDAAASTVDSPPLAADAPGASTLDPASDGTSAVATQDVTIAGATSGHQLPATIFTPTPSNRALVVISPGFQMARTQYTSYAHHLATWGFTVVLTDYADQGFFADHQAMADDVGAVITYALAQPQLAIDGSRIAVAGHSLGGDISTLAASDDARIQAVLGWDPVDGSSPSVVPEHMSSLHAALAVIGETTDASGGFMPCAPASDNFQQFYASAASPALQMTLAGADHMDWVDDPSCAYCTVCTEGTAPDSLAHSATKRLDVAWLRRVLFADAAMDAWLTTPPEVGAGTATVTRK